MAFTFSIKDTYRQAVEAASGGKQTVLYDDKGYPSIMNIIPKLSYKDVGLSDSTKALPAFMVDDAEKPEIFVGTFMATSLRIKRRLKAAAKQYVAGNLTYERYNSTLQSYMGMMKHNDCYRFKMQLLEDVETIINESGVAA